MERKEICNITVKILIVHNLLIIYCKLSESSEPWEFKSQPTKTRLGEPENWDLFVYSLSLTQDSANHGESAPGVAQL